MMYTQKFSHSYHGDKKERGMKTELRTINGEKPRFTIPKLREGVPKYAIQFDKYR